MILGINKYTHSTALCLAEDDGRILFAQARERVTRKKFDGGEITALLQHALHQTGRKLEEITHVVQNNHLFSIAPYEASLPFKTALHQAQGLALDKHNLLPGARKTELSHHLAHAWSVAPASGFEEALIVVMDGMGSPRDLAWGKAPGLVNDRSLPRARGFKQVPARPAENRNWREAETVYLWRQGKLSLRFKRWIEERTPAILYNYGFEDMESLGAIYSRISSHIFGDWNVCGKVMGLAAFGDPTEGEPLVKGKLETLKVNWPLLESLPHPNEWSDSRRHPAYRNLAARVQADLERVVLDFLKRMRKATGQNRLCFAGGVALNSQLNGLLAQKAGFEVIHVPPAPGDDGVAQGCAMFAARGPRKKANPTGAYLGGNYSEREILAALQDQAPWIEVQQSKTMLQDAAKALSRHEYLAWFQDRSEFGPRALGNRSILAHPGHRAAWKHINLKVKHREPFRPLAPSVLAERSADVFAFQGQSPFMSFTAKVKPSWKRKIPAVVHEDGTARLQTVTRETNALYYDLIQEFAQLTGIPLLLNTSFNGRGEAIVETPDDALHSFLGMELDLLVMGNFLIRKKTFPARNAWSQARIQRRTDAIIESRQETGGEILHLEISFRGRNHPAREIHHLLLESCQDRSIQECLELEADYEGVTGKEIEEALRDLFAWQVISFS